MTDENLDLTISRRIKAPRASVWAAWTVPDHLEQWWCPKPWIAEIRAFDLRPGGAFDVLMHGPDGEESPNPGAFLEIIAKEKIVFTSSLTAGWRPGTPWLAMTAIISMADEDGGTRYTARVLHKDAEDRNRHQALGFEQGWGACIDQLAALAASLG